MKLLVACIVHVLLQDGHVTRAQERETRADAPIILDEASRYGLDPLLLAAVALAESDMRPRRSSKGAVGVMGILPGGSASLGYPEAELVRPRLNIHLAARHLARLRRLCGGEPPRWLSVYEGQRKCGPSVYSGRVMDRYAWLQAAVVAHR